MRRLTLRDGSWLDYVDDLEVQSDGRVRVTEESGLQRTVAYADIVRIGLVRGTGAHPDDGELSTD